MTQPPDPTPPAPKPPVYLPEPPGAEAPPQPPLPPAPPSRGVRPKSQPEPPLHPDWSRVLQPGEGVVWQGRPASVEGPQDQSPSSLAFFLVLVFTGFAAVASGSPIPVFFGIVVLFLMRRRRRTAAVRTRRYVLTDRAAYSAREEDRGLSDLACCPLEEADEPRVQGRGLRLDRKHHGGRSRKRDRVDFDDIDDLDDVLDLIRQLRRGRD